MSNHASMLPSHGTAYAVCLLCQAARLSPRQSVDEWVRGARGLGAYLAAATDLIAPAKRLLADGLVAQTGSIVLTPVLAGIAGIADHATLRHIARVLLVADPPTWLSIAVSSNRVAREYIPTADLRALGWLEPGLDDLLIDVRRDVAGPRDAGIRKRIGDAAELVVMAALGARGLRPTHVAMISDAFGYDIEISSPQTRRIEVKGCSENGRGTFHLTRNEYEKSQLYGTEWTLTQVIFANEAFVAPEVRAAHIVGMYEVDASTVASAVPPDTSTFVWTDSALVTPRSDTWRPVEGAVAADFALPGFALVT